MAADLSTERRCPRCTYDLRGQLDPRCPECGLTFPPAQWQAGILREHRPTRLDGVDPWQPHQVLWAGLCDLLHALAAPHWVLRRIDLEGPLWAAVLALLSGLLWLVVACTGLLAWATCRAAEVSPYAGLTTALFFHVPRLLVPGVLTAAGLLALVARPRVIRVSPVHARHVLRMAGWWIPATAAPAVAPFVIVAQFWPEIGIAVAPVGPLVAAVVSLRGGWVLRGGEGPRTGVRRADVLGGVALLLAVFLAGILHRLMLEPPIELYL